MGAPRDLPVPAYSQGWALGTPPGGRPRRPQPSLEVWGCGLRAARRSAGQMATWPGALGSQQPGSASRAAPYDFVPLFFQQKSSQTPTAATQGHLRTTFLSLLAAHHPGPGAIMQGGVAWGSTRQGQRGPGGPVQRRGAGGVMGKETAGLLLACLSFCVLTHGGARKFEGGGWQKLVPSKPTDQKSCSHPPSCPIQVDAGSARHCGGTTGWAPSLCGHTASCPRPRPCSGCFQPTTCPGTRTTVPAVGEAWGPPWALWSGWPGCPCMLRLVLLPPRPPPPCSSLSGEAGTLPPWRQVPPLTCPF